MPGQIVHFEIPADDTGKSREFWGSLFGWQFQAFPGPSEYHMTQMGEGAGAAHEGLASAGAITTCAPQILFSSQRRWNGVKVLPRTGSF